MKKQRFPLFNLYTWLILRCHAFFLASNPFFSLHFALLYLIPSQSVHSFFLFEIVNHNFMVAATKGLQGAFQNFF